MLVGAVLRCQQAYVSYRVFGPHYSPDEGYYEAGVTFLGDKVFTPDIASLKVIPWRGPLYPSFIALVENLFSRPWPGHVLAAQALLSCLTVGAVFLLARSLVSPLAGVVAALLLALDLDQIMTVGSMNIHGFYGTCLLAVAIVAARWAREPSLRSSALLGAVLGATLLCRTAHFLLPFLFIAAAIAWWGSVKGGKRAAVVMGAAVVVMLPLLIRNGVRLGKPAYIDQGLGSYNLLAGAAGVDWGLTIEKAVNLAEVLEPGFKKAHAGEDRGALESSLTRLAVATIEAHPLSFAGGILRRFAIFWGRVLPYALLALLAPWLCRRDRGVQAVFLVAASLSGNAAVGLGHFYHLSVVPVLCVLSGCALGAFASRAAGDGRGLARLAWAGGGFVLAVYVVFLCLLSREAMALGWSGKADVTGYESHDSRVIAMLEDGSAASGGRWDKSCDREGLHSWRFKSRGIKDFLSGDKRAALADFQAAAKMAPHDPEIQISLGSIYAGLGLRAWALRSYDLAVKLAANDARYQKLRADALSSRASLAPAAKKN